MKEKRLEFLNSLHKMDVENISGQIKLLSDDSRGSSPRSPQESKPKVIPNISMKSKINVESQVRQSKRSAPEKSKETPRTARDNNPVQEPDSDNFYESKYRSSNGLSKFEELRDAETVMSKSIDTDRKSVKSSQKTLRRLYTKADIVTIWKTPLIF
jgi:hypothetical protein